MKKKYKKRLEVIVLSFVMLIFSLAGTTKAMLAFAESNLTAVVNTSGKNVTITISKASYLSESVSITIYNKADGSLAYIDQVDLNNGTAEVNTVLDDGIYYGYVRETTGASKIAISDFTVSNSSTPTPTPEPTSTPSPTPVPTATPEPSSTPSPTPAPTATPKPSTTPSPTPVPTATPAPTSTESPVPISTPIPTSTPTQTASPTPASQPTVPPTAGQVLANTDAATIVNGIKAAEEKATVSVDVSSNKLIDKAILDAIKNTDKTVTFIQDNIQWSFYGKNITGDTKNLDLTVKTASLSNSETPNKAAISNKVKNEEVFVVSFAENGKLPGKATIRVKLDESWIKEKNKNNLYVYYYNSATNKVELIAKQLKADENNYVQFDITHNSDYFIADRDLIQSGVIPQTGSMIDAAVLLGIGAIIMTVGILVFTISRKKMVK